MNAHNLIEHQHLVRHLHPRIVFSVLLALQRVVLLSPHNVKMNMTHCLSNSFTHRFIKMLPHYHTIISLVTTFKILNSPSCIISVVLYSYRFINV